MRFHFNIRILTSLIFLESFLISIIAFGTFDIIYILLVVLISTGFIWILGEIYEIFGFKLPVIVDLPDRRGVLVLTKQTAVIISFFIVRIILVMLFIFVFSVYLQFNYLVLVIILDLLDLLDSQMIRMQGDMVWRIFDEGTDVVVKIIFAWEFLLIPQFYWVGICLIGNVIVVIFMNWDLDYQYLKAFIPNVMYMISVYGTVWVFPLALITYFYYLFYWVFYYHTPQRIG